MTIEISNQVIGDCNAFNVDFFEIISGSSHVGTFYGLYSDGSSAFVLQRYFEFSEYRAGHLAHERDIVIVKTA